MDYFGRTAGTGDRDDDFDFMVRWQKATPEGVRAEVDAGITFLRSESGGAAQRHFTVDLLRGESLLWAFSALAGFSGRQPENLEEPARFASRAFDL